MNNLLQKRAEEFSSLIEEKAMDDVNIVRMMLDYETRDIVTEKNNYFRYSLFAIFRFTSVLYCLYIASDKYSTRDFA